ncbi:hypothetical protein GOBAR_AA13802 [Gossypium barbadense]|uniref:Uncharacterized protein n=1 Tax=Gossypium barbadense TaxID=3634 RepID=A0A2P5XU46_GOSBA|nr:hypothetical protein GOBAR_AA13802 [Gossypium barbadense]
MRQGNSTQTNNSKTGSKSAHKPCSSNNKGPIYEERRLRVEELDEWRTHKPKPHLDELNIPPNQLKVGDKVLLDAADPRIATSESNGEIPLTVLNIFPYGTVEVIHPNFGIFKLRYYGAINLVLPWTSFYFPYHHFHMHSFTRQYSHIPIRGYCLKVTLFFISSCHCGYHVKSEEFMDNDDFDTLHRHIHLSLSNCWRVVVPTLATYNPSRSKATALAPSLRYLHAILAHTLIGRRESTNVVNTHNAYFLWSIANRHVFDLAYFIALAIHHQTERHRRGVISIGPYVTRLARYFGLLNIVAKSSSLTLIGQMSLQGISSMLHMRMIER